MVNGECARISARVILQKGMIERHDADFEDRKSTLEYSMPGSSTQSAKMYGFMVSHDPPAVGWCE